MNSNHADDDCSYTYYSIKFFCDLAIIFWRAISLPFFLRSFVPFDRNCRYTTTTCLWLIWHQSSVLYSANSNLLIHDQLKIAGKSLVGLWNCVLLLSSYRIVSYRVIVAREEEVEVGRMDGALGVNGVVDSQILRTVCMNAYTCVHAVIKPIRNHHLRLLSPGQPVVMVVLVVGKP